MGRFIGEQAGQEVGPAQASYQWLLRTCDASVISNAVQWSGHSTYSRRMGTYLIEVVELLPAVLTVAGLELFL